MKNTPGSFMSHSDFRRNLLMKQGLIDRAVGKSSINDQSKRTRNKYTKVLPELVKSGK